MSRLAEIFLRCPNGLARTKLTNAYFDSKLATTSTIRNWRTTLRLLALAVDIWNSDVPLGQFEREGTTGDGG